MKWTDMVVWGFAIVGTVFLLTRVISCEDSDRNKRIDCVISGKTRAECGW